MILALDTATVTGAAWGEPGSTPSWTVEDFGSRRSNGEIIFKFNGWLIGLCTAIRPDLITFESPYVPRGRRGGINPLTLRRLMAIAGAVEAVGWGLKIKTYEATTLDVARFFIGTQALRRDAKKAATIAACARYGWITASDDAADALALWALAEATVAPDLAARRGVGPLMVGAHPIKNVKTPEPSTPGLSAGLASSRMNNDASELFNSALPTRQGKIRRVGAS